MSRMNVSIGHCKEDGVEKFDPRGRRLGGVTKRGKIVNVTCIGTRRA
jgi:hypothetical protein